MYLLILNIIKKSNKAMYSDLTFTNQMLPVWINRFIGKKDIYIKVLDYCIMLC